MFYNAPIATIIFAATIGLSLYTLYKNQALIGKLILHPYSLVRERRWYTLITSGMIHGDLSHLLFNMMTFYFFAFRLETIVGSVEFLIIYFGSMVLADVSTIKKNRDNPHYRSLGASGAISGVLFSAILYVPDSSIMLFFIPIGIPAPIFGLLYLAYCYYAAKKSQDLINHEAHFWGALTGVVLTVAMQPAVLPYFIERVFG